MKLFKSSDYKLMINTGNTSIRCLVPNITTKAKRNNKASNEFPQITIMQIPDTP